MKKEITAVICVLTFISSIFFCFTAFAADKTAQENTETKGDFIYLKDTDKIVAYIGENGICEIPENTEVTKLYDRSNPSAPITKLIINKKVDLNLILSGELQQFDSLKEVELKEGVTEIPYQAFEQCKALEKITIPSTVTEIGDYAFSNCKSLKTIELPYGVKSIGEYAFSNLPSLSGDITIPDSVTNMGANAFSDCGNLDKVHLSDNLTYTPTQNYNNSENFAGWFSNTNINEINIPKAMLDRPTCYFNADEITFDSDMTVNIYRAVEDSSWCHNKYWKGKTDKSLGDYDGFAIADDTVLKYIGIDRNPVVPDGITSIGESAFSYCDIDAVSLPQSLKYIENDAFYLSTIKSIVIPKNVSSLGDNAFDYCPLLEKITFEGNTDVGVNSVVLSNVLTEDNIIFEGTVGRAKENILSNGISEYQFSSFYNLLNKNREKIGFGNVDIPKEYTSAETNPNEPIVLPIPTTNPQVTEKPQTTDKPQATAAPEEKPETLTIKNGDTIIVAVGNNAVEFPDAQPFIDDNGRTQVPVRAVSEMLDCKVDWDGENKTAKITRENGNIINLTLDSDIMTVNDKQVQMDTAAMVRDDRTYIPVRFVAEALGLEVEWVE